MKDKPKVGDTVKLNANGRARLHATGNQQTMRITHVEAESITSPEETFIVRVDNEINRYLLDHHMFDLVEENPAQSDLEKWRAHVTGMPGSALVAHARDGQGVEWALDDLNLAVERTEGLRIVWDELSARLPPRNVEAIRELVASAATPRDATCGVCGGDGKEARTDGVGGKWTETCPQCRGRGKVKIV